MVDVSFPLDELKKYEAVTERFYLADHHQSARLAVEGQTLAHFDEIQSVAMLAWKDIYQHALFFNRIYPRSGSWEI